MPTINLFGVRHTYDFVNSSSSRPVLVFVHGWLLSRQYWQPLIQSFAPLYPCLSYDLRGFGDSEVYAESQADDVDVDVMRSPSHAFLATKSHISHRQDNPYSPAAYAIDLLELLEQLQLFNVWLVGHSLGGSIALWAATLAPERVQGVCCLNSGGGIYIEEEFQRFRTAGQQMLSVRQKWFAHIPLLDIIFSRMMVAQPLARTWGMQRLQDFLNAHPEAALRTLLDSTIPAEVYQLPQIVAKLQQPTYFIAGLQDTVMELRYVYHLASFHTSFCEGNPNVIEVPNCGHLAMLEQTNIIVAAMMTILEKHAVMGQDSSSHSVML